MPVQKDGDPGDGVPLGAAIDRMSGCRRRCREPGGEGLLHHAGGLADVPVGRRSVIGECTRRIDVVSHLLAVSTDRGPPVGQALVAATARAIMGV